MTPSRCWEAGDPEGVVSVLLGRWFEQSDEMVALERLESDAFADGERVGYRFRVRNRRRTVSRRATGLSFSRVIIQEEP